MRYFDLKLNTDDKHCQKVIDYEKAFNVLEFVGDFPPKIMMLSLKDILILNIFYRILSFLDRLNHDCDSFK